MQTHRALIVLPTFLQTALLLAWTVFWIRNF